MAPNNYKQDAGKVPLLAALQPFAPALYALAAMMEDMKAKHQLSGSRDPFNEWAQLPEAKARMAQAMERHLLPEEGTLWSVNTKDGTHLHATHGLFNLLGCLTLHLREQGRVAVQGKAAADYAPLLERARIELALSGEHQASPLHAPAGADWRGGQWWTGDHGTWHCTCGAGRPDACSCDQSKGSSGVPL